MNIRRAGWAGLQMWPGYQSLASRAKPSCKRSDILNLETTDIENHWYAAVSGLDKALQILKEDCGVIISMWLPYYTILIPFAAVLTKHPMPTGPEAAVLREKLVRWFWCSVFGQAYENAPNSQSVKDVGEIIGWLGGGPPPASVSEFQFDPRILRDTTARQRALYRGVICLLLRHRARDFHNGQLISGDLIVEHHIDDHHIFPDSYLKKRESPVTARLRDCVLNRTLIDRTTNQRIGVRPPSDYLAEIRDTLDAEEKFSTLLSSHFIPDDAASPIWRDDFDAFLEQREAALWAQIKEVTGISEAADLIEEEPA